MEARKVIFVVNPRAGRGRGKKYLKEITKFKEGLAKEKGIEVSIEPTSKSDERTAFNLAKKATREGYNYLIAVGGDGTVNEVVNGIINSDISFEKVPAVGIVQVGVGNDFAKCLGLPKGIERIFEILSQDDASIQKKIVSIDLGKTVWESGGRIFINVFSLGFDARINKFAVGFKEKFRFLSFLPLFGEGIYLFAALIELVLRLHFEYPEVEIKMPGFHIKPSRVTLIAVANGFRYGGMFKIAPQAKMEDGLLDFCQIKKMGRFRMLRNIHRLYFGTHLSLPEVETLSDGSLPKVSSVFISSSENLPCQMDGEILPAEKEYRISILPKALKVIVP